MIAEPFRRARLLPRLERLEHAGHVARVVAGARHDLRSFDVGLPLVLAAEPHERGADAEPASFRDDRSNIAANERAEDLTCGGADFVLHGLARLRGPVAQRDVAQLVR